MPWTPPDLSDTVAVVTGATRGVGRGIALVLGECGATVHVTGRSTVEAVAAEGTERGGGGNPARPGPPPRPPGAPPVPRPPPPPAVPPPTPGGPLGANPPNV